LGFEESLTPFPPRITFSSRGQKVAENAKYLIKNLTQDHSLCKYTQMKNEGKLMKSRSHLLPDFSSVFELSVPIKSFGEIYLQTRG